MGKRKRDKSKTNAEVKERTHAASSSANALYQGKGSKDAGTPQQKITTTNRTTITPANANQQREETKSYIVNVPETLATWLGPDTTQIKNHEKTVNDVYQALEKSRDQKKRPAKTQLGKNKGNMLYLLEYLENCLVREYIGDDQPVAEMAYSDEEKRPPQPSKEPPPDYDKKNADEGTHKSVVHVNGERSTIMPTACGKAIDPGKQTSSNVKRKEATPNNMKNVTSNGMENKIVKSVIPMKNDDQPLRERNSAKEFRNKELGEKEDQIKMLQEQVQDLSLREKKQLDEIETLRKDLKCIRGEKNAAEEFMSKELGEKEHQIKTLQEQIQDLSLRTKAAEHKGDKKEKLKLQIKQMQTENASRQRQFDDNKRELENKIQTLNQEIAQLRKVNTDYSHRLAAEMGNKVASDESAVENVSIKNRPMNVAEDYNLIRSNAWLEAKSVLDKNFEGSSQEERIKVLVKVFEVGEQCASDAREKLDKYIDHFLRDPIGAIKGRHDAVEYYTAKSEAGKRNTVGVPPVESAKGKNKTKGLKEKRQTLDMGKSLSLKPGKASTTPLEITNAVGDYLRSTSDNVNLEDVKLQMLAKMSQEHFRDIEWNKIQHHFDIQEFIDSVCKLSWNMAIQRPPMKFHFEGEVDKHHDLYWGSQEVKNAKVFLVYPRLYHKDQLMVRGMVYLVDPAKSEKASPQTNMSTRI